MPLGSRSEMPPGLRLTKRGLPAKKNNCRPELTGAFKRGEGRVLCASRAGRTVRAPSRRILQQRREGGGDDICQLRRAAIRQVIGVEEKIILARENTRCVDE